LTASQAFAGDGRRRAEDDGERRRARLPRSAAAHQIVRSRRLMIRVSLAGQLDFRLRQPIALQEFAGKMRRARHQ